MLCFYLARPVPKCPAICQCCSHREVLLASPSVHGVQSSRSRDCSSTSAEVPMVQAAIPALQCPLSYSRALPVPRCSWITCSCRMERHQICAEVPGELCLSAWIYFVCGFGFVLKAAGCSAWRQRQMSVCLSAGDQTVTFGGRWLCC